jgi:3-oxoacyl-[acyl-carrier-protein] synthase-3
LLISYALPKTRLKNEDMESLGWSSDKVFEKTGIRSRFVCTGDESALTLATEACEKLFQEHGVPRDSVDYLLYCTQTPDTLIPTNACVLQDRLRLNTSIGALDFNLGCSGFVYGLSLAKGLLQTGQAKSVLLVTAETYSVHIDDQDRANRLLFGDAAAATLITKRDAENLGQFVFGTDGSGADNLCLRAAPVGSKNALFMNGPEILSFALSEVPKAVRQLLENSNLTPARVDHFIFHQANAYVINALRDKLDLPEDKTPIYVEDIGNTVSSTIPIAFHHLLKQNKIRSGSTVVFVGFGVGYSWAATVFKTS